MTFFLTLLAIAASVLGSGMALPQARHLARTRRVDGVSATWVGVSMTINSWWVAYAISGRLWIILPVSIISVVLYTTIAVFLVRTVGRAAVPGLLAGMFVLGMVPMPFLVAGGWALAGVAVGLCYGLQILPAVVTVLRTRALSGVSAPTWTIALAEALLWLAYGVGVSDGALVSAGLAGSAMSAVILVRLAVTGHAPMSSFGRLARAAGT